MHNTKKNTILNLYTPPSCAIGFTAVAIDAAAAGRLQQEASFYILLAIVLWSIVVSCSIPTNQRANIANVRTNISNRWAMAFRFYSYISSAALCVVGNFFFFFISFSLFLCYCGCCKTNWANAVSGWRFRMDNLSTIISFKNA